MPGPARAPAGRRAALEIRGPADGLLDDPLLLRARGAGADVEQTWRARYRDDDGRVWRSAGARADELATRWTPAKDSTGAVAALRSPRPVIIEVQVETADGRSAARTISRRLSAEGVRSRRWRNGLVATLHVPVHPQPCATLVVDATGGPEHELVAAMAAPLLASRGALALVVAAPARRGIADPIAAALERLAAVPAARGPILVLSAIDPHADAPDAGVVLPPGIGARDESPATATARAAAWDALLERLGALPRAAS